MKNVFKLMSLLFILLINFSYAQKNERKVKLACYKTSCCSFLGFFDVDIISTTHCHYLVTNKNGSTQDLYSSYFDSTEPIKDGTTTLNDDIVLPQFKDESGNPLVLPKGEYTIANNEVQYSLSSKFKIKKACLQEHVQGTILGHEVNYTITVCAYYPSFGKSASMCIKFELTNDQREEIRKNNDLVNIKEDITITNEDGSYIMKAGDYFLNENDEAYIINIPVK